MNKLDKAIFEIAHQDVPGPQLEAAAVRVRKNLFAQNTLSLVGPQRLRGCADFQALIPAYLDKTLSAGRSLLLQDHTRDCVACRQALQHARAGAPPTLARPVTPPSRTISNTWAIAAMAALTVGLGAWLVSRAFVSGGGQVAVQTVSGILYTVSDTGSTPIFSGHQIGAGQHIRTAKNSSAVLRLGDGSLVEMNERAELSVSPDTHGANIRLDQGNIIIQAAKQRSGTLNVLTADCTVSVKGTIFAVGRGTKGTRVSVVEGSVKVEQGAQTQMLKPGDQATTDASLVKTAVTDEVGWSRDSARYINLLGEFNAIKQGLDAVPSPALRYESKLLPYASSDTVLYAAIPNLSANLAEAQRLFNDRLQQSDVLRAWWEEQKDGAKLQEMMDSVRRFSDYLGNEVVFTVAGNGDGEYSEPVIMAEVKNAGLETFLTGEMQKFSARGAKGLPEVVHLEAPATENSNPNYWRAKRRAAQRSGSSAKSDHMMIGLKDGLMVVAWSQSQLDEIAQRATNAGSSEGSNQLTRNAQHAYQEGAAWLMCVNMEQIARNSVRYGKGAQGAAKLPKGIDAMRDLIVERKEVGGRVQNKATLTFEGGRSGLAAWLATPSPMGSLDFISPNATFAVSMALRSPQSMLNDIFEMIGQDNPKFDEDLQRLQNRGIALSRNLAIPLGGEFTFALDGPLLPLPSWKFAVEVYSPDSLQWAIDQLVASLNSDSTCPDCKVTLDKEAVGTRTFYTLTSEKASYEIDYVYVDGYLLAAPSRTLLNKAIQNRETGYVLSHSDAFRSQLPRDGRLNFSALIYHNVGTALSPIANQLGAVSRMSAAQQQTFQSVANNMGPGLIYAYGEPDRIAIATDGTFFGLDLNALAIPNLMNMAMRGQPAMKKHQ